jgi:TnpA family transposase
VEISEDFRKRILEGYNNNLSWQYIKEQICINKELGENAAKLRFKREV